MSLRDICIDSLLVNASEIAVKRQIPFPGANTPSSPNTSILNPGVSGRARLSAGEYLRICLEEFELFSMSFDKSYGLF